MPTRYRTVTDFLDDLTSDRRAEVDSLRALVLASHSGLVEGIKWNSPNFALDGVDRLTVNVPRSGSARLILHRGVAVAEDATAAPTFGGDPTGLLTWHSDIRASLQAPASDDAATRARLQSVVRAWLDS